MYPAIRRLFVFVGSGLAYVLLPDERQVDNRLNMALECASLVHSFPKQAIWRIVPRIVSVFAYSWTMLDFSPQAVPSLSMDRWAV